MVGGLLVVVCPTISAADDPWPVSTLCVQGLLCPAKHTPWTVYSITKVERIGGEGGVGRFGDWHGQRGGGVQSRQGLFNTINGSTTPPPGMACNGRALYSMGWDEVE